MSDDALPPDPPHACEASDLALPAWSDLVGIWPDETDGAADA